MREQTTTRRSLRNRFTALATAGLMLLATAPMAVASQGVEVISFDKQFDPLASAANGTPTWTGTIPGGTLEVRLVDYDAGPGKVDHMVVDFIVNGDYSFTARLEGIFNNVTERTTLNGVVTSGDFAGARVHEEGLRIDAAASRFLGTIRIMTGSA